MAASVPGLYASSALGVAQGYNLFDLGAFTVTSGTSDIQGSVAVGGALAFSSGAGYSSINQSSLSASPATPGLIVEGNASFSGGQLDNGNAGLGYFGGNVSGTYTFQHGYDYVGTTSVGGTGTHIAASSMPITAAQFASAATSLEQLSSTLGGESTAGTVNSGGATVVNNSGNYTLTATSCSNSLCVFDLPSASTYNSITITAPSGAAVVINVPGSSANGSAAFSNGQITYNGSACTGGSSCGASNVLMNFTSTNSAGTLSASGYGLVNVLAPYLTFTGGGGHIDGELIIGAINESSGASELEGADIFSNSNLPSGGSSTPEPATWVLMGTAMLAFAGFRSKRAATVAVK